MRGFALTVVVVLGTTLFAGCITSYSDLPDQRCSIDEAIQRGVRYLGARAHPAGGIRADADPALTPDVRTTAWVLIATALARRAGHEGAFGAEPHLRFLEEHAAELVNEGSALDSVPNNLSLARAAFQTWGRDPFGIPLQGDGATAVTIGNAWESHHDPRTGRYGERLNEHLFGHFAALLSEPEGDRRSLMQTWVHDPELNPFVAADGTVVYLFDAWYAAYARLALGPTPSDAALARELDATLAAHRHDDGGVRGFAHGERPDASSTAAALVAWAQTAHASASTPTTSERMATRADHAADAAAWLCEHQAQDGHFPFDREREFMPVKTTAEAVIALALHVEPIPM